MDAVCKPFVEAKGQDWDEFKAFLVSPDYKCDEIGLLVFGRMYYIHIAIIVNDWVWTTHHKYELSQSSVVLGYCGFCDFVLLKPRADFPPDTEREQLTPVEKPKIQRKPIDLSAATWAKKNKKRHQRRKQKQQVNAVLRKYGLRSKKRTTPNSRNLVKKPD